MIDGFETLAMRLASDPASDEATLRRAVSTAYYAAFNALCAMIAETIVGHVDDPLYARVYRRLDHRQLASPSLFKFAESTRAVQNSLDDLKARRIEADYVPGPFRYSQAEVLDIVRVANDAITLIRSLEDRERRELSINLLIGGPDDRGPSRKAQLR
jgi:hypothetical protein